MVAPEERDLLTHNLDLFYVKLAEVDVTIEKMQQSLNDIQARLTRLDPLIEYAEQLLDKQARVAKWIPGMSGRTGKYPGSL